MKTFKEFLEEAYLSEMRKEDKVKGETKTPLHITSTTGRVVKSPEGKLKVEKSTRKALSPRAATGRMKQGMLDKETTPYAIRMPGAARHAQGGGGYGAEKAGRLRGVGKLEKQKMDKEKRDRGERPFGSGQSPADKVALKQARRKRSMGSGR